MKPFTVPHMKDLQPGDTFKTEGLFQGLCDEEVEWTVLLRQSLGAGTNPMLTLEARYFGVYLATVEVIVRARSLGVHVLA